MSINDSGFLNIQKLKSFYQHHPEQQRIAEILETVDNAIEKTDQIIEKYKRIKQGLMQNLLNKGVTVNGDSGGDGGSDGESESHRNQSPSLSYRLRDEKRDKFKDSPLGRIPEEWEVMRLGEVIDLNPEKVDYTRTNTIKYVDIESVYEGKIIKFQVLIPKEAPSRARRLVRENDVIISTVRPNLKAFSMITKKFDMFVCSTGFAVLRCNCDRIYPAFLFYISLYDNIFLKQILPMVVGSNYPAVNSQDVCKIQIPLPPLPEQQRIASILSQIDETIEKETAYKEKLQRLKSGLMEDLLTGNVRVNHLIKEK